MIFRLIQNYAIFMMPACTDFWNRDQSTSSFVSVITIPMHFCILPASVDYHAGFAIGLFVFFVANAIGFFRYLLRDSNECSSSNRVIFYLCLLFTVLVPIGSFWSFSLSGKLVKEVAFMGVRTPLVVTGMALSIVASIVLIVLHYVGFLVIRGSSSLKFDAIFYPWAPFNVMLAHGEMYFGVLAFLEECLPLNEKWYCIGFSIACLLVANPGCVAMCLIRPLFQDVHDSVHLATLLMIGMAMAIVMDLHWITDQVKPSLVFVFMVLLFVVFMTVFQFIVKRRVKKYMKALYSVYKQSSPALPPAVLRSDSVRGGQTESISHEAYMVIQAFNSLEITSPRVFMYYLSVGAMVKMPAIRNIDFVKWGLRNFTDYTTLIICAQICHHFDASGQTLFFLIQKLREPQQSLSIFLSTTLHNLSMDHADSVSNKPSFLKLEQKKATASLVRCRRALGVFWGCVLKHSPTAMKESLCTLRDYIREANSHFDEVMRCYPLSLESMALNLSFMTEVKGKYLECNKYINDMSAQFIEMKSGAYDDEESMDGISVLLQDPNRTFSQYLSKLSLYMEQERQAKQSFKGPVHAIWSLTIVSVIVIIGCILFIIIDTLVSFNYYPTLLMIINSVVNVFIELAALTLGCRRLCLFASAGLMEPTINFGTGGSDTSMYDKPDVLIPWLLQEGDVLPQMIELFYKNTSISDSLSQALQQNKRPLMVFGKSLEETLPFAFDIASMAIRNIATNIPRRFQNTQLIKSVLSLESREDFSSLMKRKWHEQFQSGPLSGNFAKIEAMNKDTIANMFREHSALYSTHSTALAAQNITDFTAICESQELNLLLKNIEPTAVLCDDFLSSFNVVSADTVNSLGTVLYWSMIFLPIAYLVVFGLALLLVALYVHQEAEFRLTLFLSLPEQVASEIVRSEGGSNTQTYKKKESKNDQDSPNATMKAANPTILPMTMEFTSAEAERMKEKALTVEGLCQFSTDNAYITGQGLKPFVAWCIVYIIIAACSVFGLTYYARSVNSTFQARSLMLCASALRFSMSEYAYIFMQEGFLHQYTLFDKQEIIRLTEQFLNSAEELHNILTYGDENIYFNFRESGETRNVIFVYVNETVPSDFNISRSATMIQHDGYRYLGFHSHMHVFLESTRAILELFKMNSTRFNLNDDTWQQYDHLIVGHLVKNLENATVHYLSNVQHVVQNSFIVALTISLVALVVLILIVIGPIRMAAHAMQGYFDTMLHVLCHVPPQIFRHSVYINKWLKGHISRSNYNQYEATFKRTVSPQIQTQIIAESPEKVLLFNSAGIYMDASSYDASEIEQKTVSNVLPLAIDVQSNPKIVEDVEKIVQRFLETKDAIENVNIMAKSHEGFPVKLTITGLSTSDSTIISSTQKYYHYVAILVNDAREEASEEEQYQASKEKTLRLLKQLVPPNFAIRIHDGERRISLSAAVASVLVLEVVNFQQALNAMPLEAVPEMIMLFRRQVESILAEIENMSLIRLHCGSALFVAGLFNEEASGLSEAVDTILFVQKFNRILTAIRDKHQLGMANMRYAMCTGGPIYCKILMDNSPISLVSGDPISMASALMAVCKPGQLVMDRTTRECLHGIITAEPDGEFEFGGHKMPHFAVDLVALDGGDVTATKLV